MDVSQWQWAAPMYNGMKISNDVRVLEHKVLHNQMEIAQRKAR
jgi:hypothetical protein